MFVSGMKQLIPANKIVICKDAPREKLKSGVELINQEKGEPEVGIVYAIGTGKRPVALKVGDKIVYRKYSENKVFIGGTRYNFVRFEDIVAVAK